MANLIEQYESIARASAAMLECARRGDWDALVAAEAECAALVDRLRTLSMRHSVPPSERDRKASLIREVLRHDAEIRDLAMPWMAKLQELIGGAAMERRVSQAYGGSLP